MRSAALRDYVARTPFAPATLGGHAEFELNLIESHACARVPRNIAIGDSTTHTDDHDEKVMAGWLEKAEYK